MTRSLVPPFGMFVGCGRSGTTMVRAIFDSHSQLAVTHHAQFLVSMGGHRSRYESRAGLDRARFRTDLVASHRFAHLQLTPGDIEAVLADPVPDLASGLRRVLALYAERQGKLRYADKTPGHVTRIKLLADLFDETRFVHIIRDGRNSWVGYRDRGFGPKRVADAAFNWKNRVERGRRAGAALGPQRYLEVRYEDVVEDPAASLAPVCRFLDLDFVPAMLEFQSRAETVLAGLEVADRKDFENLYRPLTKGMRNWSTEMAPNELAAFESIAGDLLADLGYELGSAAASHRGLQAEVERARRWAEWQGRRGAFQATLVRRRLTGSKNEMTAQT